MDIYTKALVIATEAHDGQRRKYVDQPYICHPMRVSGMVMQALSAGKVDGDYVRAVGAAALLHDVIEDCEMSAAELEALLDSPEWGRAIVHTVMEVTNRSKGSTANRAARKQMDKEHLAESSYWGATIKLADLIDNTSSIVEHDASFAKVYLPEKAALLEVLKHGHKGLYAQAKAVVEKGMKHFGLSGNALVLA